MFFFKSLTSGMDFFVNHYVHKILKLLTIVLRNLQNYIVQSCIFLSRYYTRNELLWVDGFIIDFLQKKSIDLFLRKFVIYTGFIFSERLVFEYVVRFYLDNLV